MQRTTRLQEERASWKTTGFGLQRFTEWEKQNWDQNRCQDRKIRIRPSLCFGFWRQPVCSRVHSYPSLESDPVFDLIQNLMFTWSMKNLVIDLPVYSPGFWSPACRWVLISQPTRSVPTHNDQKPGPGAYMPFQVAHPGFWNQDELFTSTRQNQDALTRYFLLPKLE